MALVTGAIGSIAPKLLELLKDEYKLQKDLRKEVKSLSNELDSVHAALCKVSEVSWDKLDDQVKIWARQVREASYDMEDILDTFLVRVEDHDPAKKGRLKRALKNMSDLFSKGRARHDIGGAIEDIKKQLLEVADRRSRYKVDEIVAKPVETTSTVDPRLGAMLKEVTQLIGINKSRDDIISLLQVDENSTKMVSIVGVGGLGKTTLAKASYDKLKSLYECTAFVSVGRNPDIVKVFKDILFYLDEVKYKDIHNTGRGVDLLIRELHKFLQNKRYFIVIDDVWDIISWKTIKSALVQTNSGSRVIITTRNREVASEEEVYELDPLSSGDSKRLFYIRLFGSEGKCPAHHPAEASEKILKKCGGVPLAIITMASLLVGKSTEDWIDLCNSPGFYRGKGNQQVDDTEWILSLSYYDLPSYLKTCLLYLSMYPEDYEIEKDSLIWKWIAEGFVEKKRGTSLFQQGEEYFTQLLNRSMIQVVESDIYMGLVGGCRVHDMVLDLIRDLSYRENFVTISNDYEGISPHQYKVRRLAHQRRMMKQDDHLGLAQVRSFVACRCDIITESWALHPSFKLLRVLGLEGCNVSGRGLWKSLKHIGNLVHLRYLGLRRTYGLDRLPEEIGKLKFLQTLDLQQCGINELPSGVCQLTQLVCLRGDVYTSAPDGFLRKVTSLEDLRTRIDNLDEESQRQFLKDVGNLSEARVLEIRSFKGMLQPDLVQSLGSLHKLQHLRVYGDGTGEAVMREWDRVVLPRHLRRLGLGRIPFLRVPSRISPVHLPSLHNLSLDMNHMDEAGLRAVSALPELRELVLTSYCPSMACMTTVSNITVGDGFFQKLRRFELFGWMIQLVPNKDFTSVSFSIWNGKGVVAFDSKTTDDQCSRSAAPQSVMPSLQELRFEIPVRALYKDANGSCDNLGLECLPSHCIVTVIVEREGASADDVKKAKAQLRHITQLHPNQPILEIVHRNGAIMMGKSTDQDDEEPPDDSAKFSAKEQESDELPVAESRVDDPATPTC
ncbi:unnamed protein product [Urochloa humidicola]